MQRRTPKSTLTDTLFPYQTVFRSLCRLNSLTCRVLVNADANGPALLPEAVENLNPAARIGAAIGKPGIAIALQAQLFVQLVGERCSRLAAVGRADHRSFAPFVIAPKRHLVPGVIDPAPGDRKSTRLNSSH